MPEAQVSLIGYRGEPCIATVANSPNVRLHLLGSPFASLPRALFLLWAPLKVLYQVCVCGGWSEEESYRLRRRVHTRSRSCFNCFTCSCGPFRARTCCWCRIRPGQWWRGGAGSC